MLSEFNANISDKTKNIVGDFRIPANVKDNTQTENKAPTTDCAVCLNNIEVLASAKPLDSQDSGVSLPCGHTFHSRCLSQWAIKGALSCPNCRDEVDLRKVDIEVISGIGSQLLRANGKHSRSSQDMRAKLMTYLGELTVKHNAENIVIGKKALAPHELFQKTLRIDPKNARAAADLALTWPDHIDVMKIKNPQTGQQEETNYQQFVKYACSLNPDNADLRALLP